MTRFEENEIIIKKMVETMEKNPTGTYEEMVAFQLGTIAAMLTDISKSLAILANDKVPLVTPQPKIGLWIDDKCSECGKGTEDLISSREWYRNENPNFCPFCGAKLVDSQAESEK